MTEENMALTVFANGIWKSGNHLLLKLCDLLQIPDSKFGIATSTLMGRHYLVRRALRGPRLERCPISVGLDMAVSVRSSWLRRKIRRHQGMCIGGHAAYSDALLDLLVSERVRPIHIVRDPRDIVVSFAHWIGTRPDYYAYPAFAELSAEERMLRVIHGARCGAVRIESLSTVLDRAYGWLTRPGHVLVVRFEDLVGESGGGDAARQYDALQAIHRWLGTNAADPCTIAANLFGGTRTFRRGRIGSWKDEFSPRTLDAFNEVVGGRLKQWGYE